MRPAIAPLAALLLWRIDGWKDSSGQTMSAQCGAVPAGKRRSVRR